MNNSSSSSLIRHPGNPSSGLLSPGGRCWRFFNCLAIVALGMGSVANAQSNYTTPYAFTTFAGSGAQLSGSENGPIATASFSGPNGVAVDSSGNVFVADSYNHKIRKITPAGVVTTFAGTGYNESTDGVGAAASINQPYGVAVDSSGNVYVSEIYSHKIRKISPAGEVSTLAGSGTPGSTNGIGTAASFKQPHGLAVDASGNVFVADFGNHKIRKITSSGVVTTFVGSGSSGSADGTGTAASFNNLTGLALDTNDNLYVADTSNRKIRKITPAGVVTTLAGSGAYGSADGTGTAASFNDPRGVAVDASGNVYVGDSGSRKIRKITPAGGVTTLAGSGAYGSADGIGTVASFSSLDGLAVGAGGEILVADGGNNRIRKITQTGQVSVFAGSNLARDDTGPAASFNIPLGAAVDSIGNIYIADTGNHKIRKVTTMGVVTTFAGTGLTGSSDGTGTVASFTSPYGVAVDATGNVFVADAGNSKIRKITPAGVVTTFAGSGTQGSTNGTGTAASFTSPQGVAIDASGNLFVADTGSQKIRKITQTGVVTTLAGSGVEGSTNGSPTAASFNTPQALTVDVSGNVYVADRLNHMIRKITSAGVVSTFAGSTTSGSADGIGIAARFWVPTGVAMDTAGNVLVVDQFNHKIRKITPAGVVSTIAGSGNQASVDGSGPDASLSSPAGVAVDASGNVFITEQGSNKIRKGVPAPLTQTISFNSLANKSITSLPFAVNASASSGLPVSFSILSGPATLDGNIVTLTGPGTVVVSAFQSGNASYGAAPTVYHSFIVTVETTTTYSGYSFTTLAGSGYTSTSGSEDGISSIASFYFPAGVAVDTSGNIFVADTSNHKIRKITPGGVVTTFAGSGTQGATDGAGATARFNSPMGVAADTDGNLYVADTDSNKIRKITSAGVVSTMAGSGSVGNSNGNSTSASFNSPRGITVDAAGNIFVADTSNHRIRKVTQAGVVSNFAGSGIQGSTDGSGSVANFSSPQSVAVDGSGNVYVADSYNHKIRKVTSAGVVSTLAGAATSGSADGIGTSAGFANPTGVTVDPSGNVFVADHYNNKIRKITPAGMVITVAGSGNQRGNDGAGAEASFTRPNGLVVDASGNIIVADSTNRIRKISPAAVVSTLAGRSLSKDGIGAEANFDSPASVAVDASGNVFVADSTNSIIRKISPLGAVSTIAGSGNIGTADGIGTAASFDRPNGVAVDGSGNLYVSDTYNHKIRKITPAGVVTTFAGSGSLGSVDGAGATARFGQPRGLAVDGSGNIYVSDTYNHMIRKITPAGVVITLAGSGASGSLDGSGPTARFFNPCGLTVDASGNVYVADSSNHKIRKITPAGVVTTFAGSGNVGSLDGSGPAASFNSPQQLAMDVSGNVFVADTRNRRIRKISPWGEVTTVAGSSTLGSADGFGTGASFNLPSGMAVDAAGSLYIADTGNNKIRKGVLFSGTSIPQTITFSNLQAKVYGDPSFVISATATSSLPVSFNIVSGPATVSGNTITLTGAGTVRVRASQSGNEVYTAAPTVDRALLITGGTIPNVNVVTFSSAAGSGIQIYGSADGTGTEASFASPSGVAVDAGGNVYIADFNNNKIRKMTSEGAVTTFAGSGLAGSADGPGATASFNQPYGVAVDASGNVYVADRLNYKIRKISPVGEVSTLAGSGASGGTNGIGSAASFNLPTAVAVDAAENVFVVDSRNHLIRKITPTGVVTTFAGSGAAGGADGIGTGASFNQPIGVAVDASGNLYVTDYYNRKIRKITPAGVVTTFAGSGTQGSSDGPGNAASFIGLGGVAVDANGNVFVADTYDNKLRKITPAGVVTTFAGSGIEGRADGTGIAANFYNPVGVAVDGSGNVFVADTGNHKIRKISPAGVVTTAAGVDMAQDGTGTVASFYSPCGLAVDSSGNLFVADTYNNKIRRITPEGMVTTFAGSGLAGSTDGTGAAASFREPFGVAVDGNDNVFVADTSNNKIRKITPAGVVSTLAGSGDQGGANGSGPAASFSQPSGVAVDGNGNVFVADRSNQKIRKISAAGVVTTFAGSGFSGSTDGTGAAASFSQPSGVAVDMSGNLFVADTWSNKIRKISPTGVVTTFAGSGSQGSADGSATGASFNRPTGVTVDINGNVFIADRENHKIRKISSSGAVSTLAGSAPFGSADGIGIAAGFNAPFGVAVDVIGNLFVADSGNNRIRRGVAGLTQVVTFDPLPDRMLSGAPFTLIATSTSGLPVTFSILSGPATLSGNLVTLTDLGTVIVRASQAGNASYAAALAADHSFIVIANSAPAIPLSNWASSAGLSGQDAIPSATPFNDGVPNLLKYAFNMNATGPDVSVLATGGSSGLPKIMVDSSGTEPILRVEFLRRKGSGLIYTPQRSTTLGTFTAMTGTQTVSSINSLWERVSVVESAPPSGARSFARVQVSLP